MNRLLVLGAVAAASCAGQAPSPRQAVAPPSWCVEQVVDTDQNPIFITVDLGAAKDPQQAELPWLVQVNVTVGEQNANGHPTDQEALVLNQLEDSLSAVLRNATRTRLVGRVTSKGAREIVYYVAEPDRANAVLADQAKRIQPRAWEFRVTEDRRWAHLTDMIGPTPECL